MPASARDGALSFNLTAPPESVTQPGVQLSWQETLGRRLILGGGLGISEPRPTDRQLGARLQLSLPFDAGLSQQWYPWVGVEQPLAEGLPNYQWHFGVGIERHWLPEAAGFIEARYQPALDSAYHLQLGLRFWPGRLQRLDARLRDSDPLRPTDENDAFSERIVLSIPGQASTEPDSPDSPPSGPPTVPATQTQKAPKQQAQAETRAADSLAPGYYLHLGLFGAPESVRRYRSQIVDRGWADQVYTLVDPEAGGTRILLGPFVETEARQRRQALADQGIDSFLYRWPRP